MRRLVNYFVVAMVFASCICTRVHAGTDQLTRELRRLIAPGAVEREQVLGALRALRDDRLTPLFSDLALGGDPIGRVYGVLALAELNEQGASTTAMIARVKDPQEQTLMIVRTLRDDLLSDAQVREIIAWPELEEGLEVLLLSHVREDGGTSLIPRLEELSGHESPSVGVVASLVLMDLGHEIDPESLMTRLREQGVGIGSSGVAYLLDFIRREELRGAAPFVDLVLETPDLSTSTRADALATVLAIEPERARERWTAAWEEASGLVDQIRLTLAAVSAWRTAPVDLLETVADSSSPVTRAMGRAAVAFRAGEDEAAWAIELWKTGYAPGIEWMVSSVEFLRDKARNDVRRALVETEIEGMRSNSLVLMMLTDGIADESPDLLCEMARDAAMQGNARLCRIALNAMIRNGRIQCAADFDQMVWPDAGLASLAEVVAASAGSDRVRSDRLERIALGLGSQQRAARAVAAWESLTRAGQDRRALAMLLGQE